MWIILLVLLVIVVAFLYHKFPLCYVDGYSMYPTYSHGNILLAKRHNYKEYLYDEGDIVIAKREEHLVVKRITKCKYDFNFETNLHEVSYWLEGDNKEPGRSLDSRVYGYVHESNIIGKVICVIKK